jgi:hypothetical protein
MGTSPPGLAENSSRNLARSASTPASNSIYAQKSGRQLHLPVPEPLPGVVFFNLVSRVASSLVEKWLVLRLIGHDPRLKNETQNPKHRRTPARKVIKSLHLFEDLKDSRHFSELQRSGLRAA